MRKFLAAAVLATLLAACGDEQTATIPASWSPTNKLIYAYPYNGQAQIAPKAPVVLHFAAKLNDTTPAALKTHFTLTGPGSPDFTVKRVDDGRGVVLQPETDLVENATYTVSWSNLGSADGNIQPVPISFTTRPANKGPRNLMVSGSNKAIFTLERSLPVQNDFPVMDFSSFRLQFNQPVDQKTLVYGNGASATFSVVDNNDAVVPARIYASNRLLTIDPKDDLIPGKTYTLKLGTGIKSTLGDSLVAVTRNFIPRDSKPRATMALEAAATGAPSLLTGEVINKVPIVSTLLGNESASQQSGNLYAELAFVPNYPKTTPLRVKRGNMLSGSSVDVKILGKLRAELNTGAIRVDIISDANGYMADNPYSTAVDAPRQVYLTMDVAMSAADSSSNGAFNQNILHVDVVGTSIVKNGKLVMDAVGVVELDVLGLDQASGVLSFHLEGYQDQPNAPAQAVDSTAPSVQSWLPGNEVARTRPGDPVILTFTEPLDPATITSTSLIFLKGGVSEPFTWRADGSSIVLQPQTPLAHNANYTVQLTAGIKDIAGNPLSPTFNHTFTLPTLGTPASRSPVVLTTYPGYPCVSTGASVTVSGSGPSGTQGRCAGGKADDDVMPLPEMPTNRSIQVQFSQNINPASITNSTFKVESSSNGSSWTIVPGHIEVSAQSLQFSPDTPWTVNGLYRYTLFSNGNNSSSACNSSTAICGSNGLPLQTQILAADSSSAPAANGGGPNMVILFKTVAPGATVLQRLRGLPASDVNANFVHDSGETDATGSGDSYSAINGARIKAIGRTGLVSNANVGCAIGSSCPLKQFLFLSTTLDADIADYVVIPDGSVQPPPGAAVRVLIQPTQIIASSVDVYAESLGQTIIAATGPQIMRVRYAQNPANANKRELPVTAYITNDGTSLRLSATLDLYLDEPQLDPKLAGFSIGHNLHSYKLTTAVSGPVKFLPDGRMLATLSNDSDVPITVSLNIPLIPGLLSIPGIGGINLVIPQGTLIMQGVSSPIKK